MNQTKEGAQENVPALTFQMGSVQDEPNLIIVCESGWILLQNNSYPLDIQKRDGTNTYKPKVLKGTLKQERGSTRNHFKFQENPILKHINRWVYI